jgi:hypothetical protein
MATQQWKVFCPVAASTTKCPKTTRHVGVFDSWLAARCAQVHHLHASAYHYMEETDAQKLCDENEGSIIEVSQEWAATHAPPQAPAPPTPSVPRQPSAPHPPPGHNTSASDSAFRAVAELANAAVHTLHVRPTSPTRSMHRRSRSPPRRHGEHRRDRFISALHRAEQAARSASRVAGAAAKTFEAEANVIRAAITAIGEDVVNFS